MDHTIVTADNIDVARESCQAIDQRKELIVGCRTWDTTTGSMTVWPNGRAAVCFGGDSVWGDWDDKSRTLKTDDGGVIIDEFGDFNPSFV